MTGSLRAGAGGSGGSGTAALIHRAPFPARNVAANARQRRPPQSNWRSLSSRDHPSRTAAWPSASRFLTVDSAPCNANKASRFGCLPRSSVLSGGTAPEASILFPEVSGLGPRLHLRGSGWRAAVAPRPNLSSGGNTNWCGRSDLAPSGTFIWRSTSPMAR